MAHHDGETDDPLARFDLDAAKLPAIIDKGAHRSGGYPYKDKLAVDVFEKRMRPLQIDLVKMQSWAREAGERVVILFEGRDASGKGGAIQWFTRNLNPRGARVVALPKPTESERGQWYFQRYIHHLPTRGEITIFDPGPGTTGPWSSRSTASAPRGRRRTSCTRRRPSSAC